jgi:Flp pilus assembly protein CpaB
MNRRALLLLLVLVVVAAGLVLVLIQTGILGGTPAPTPITEINPQGTPIAVVTGPTATPITYVKVVIAVQELPRGIVIPEGAVDVREWPVDTFPNFGIQDPKLVTGRIARTDIARGMPVLETQLVDNLFNLGLSGRGSDAAAVIPPGKVAIAVPIDRLTNVAHAPKSGDRVDVIISFLFVDVDEEFQSIKPNRVSLTSITPEGGVQILTGLEGRVEPSGDFPNPVVVGPSERQRPRLVTQRTVQNALVLNVGMFTKDGDFLGRRPTPTAVPVTPGGPPTPTQPPSAASPTPDIYNPDIITLVVDPQDAVTLAWTVEAGLPLYFTLRSAQDESTSETGAVSLDYMLTTYQITQPQKLPYGLEPPITSIRKLAINLNLTALEGQAGQGQGQ